MKHPNKKKDKRPNDNVLTLEKLQYYQDLEKQLASAKKDIHYQSNKLDGKNTQIEKLKVALKRSQKDVQLEKQMLQNTKKQLDTARDVKFKNYLFVFIMGMALGIILISIVKHFAMEEEYNEQPGSTQNVADYGYYYKQA